MRDLDDLAQSMFARCASQGQAAAVVDDRHEAEALRAELRRLAREFNLRVRTVYQGGRVIVARGEDMPWDQTGSEAAQAAADLPED